ncbi:MAG: hypothetical protein IVW54_17420 [Candidatus Binataceae bacterium]|nr:hypothetical protein [Candidatus Binataceae bacterium]
MAARSAERLGDDRDGGVIGRTHPFAIAILACALATGGVLRFANLGAREMSADEGASWAAASAPTLRGVLRAQIHLNPGKAGLHDVMLHAWIGAWGDSLAAMRALSALAGTIAIALVFALTREMLAIGAAAPGAAKADAGAGAEFSAGARDCAAACAAMLFAGSLVTIKYSREVRMYPIEIAAVLAQVLCLLRAVHRGGARNFAGVVLFTAMALAAHLTAALVMAGEGLWLARRAVSDRANLVVAGSVAGRACELIGALALGAAVLAPLAPAVIGSTAHAATSGAIGWIERPAPWAPIAMFNKAAGSFAFPVIALLAVWGAVCGWRRAPAGTFFALAWMWTPPLMLLALSYLVRPVFVERYAVTAFAPFFILAAIGIVELPRAALRIPALILVVMLALGHAGAWARKPHDAQWSEGASAAQAAVIGGGTIAVAPGYAANVVSYYLRGTPAMRTVNPDTSAASASASVAIIGEQGLTPATRDALTRAYPHPLANLRGVVVRGR